MKPRALMLSPELPYPLQGGGALRTASLLNYLAQHHAVDLILFRHLDSQRPLDSLPAGLVDRVLVLELPRHSRTRVSRVVRNTKRLLRGTPPLLNRFEGFGPRISSFLAGRHYRLGVVEHFWCAPYVAVIAPYVEATVMDLHNVESVLHQTQAFAADSFMERLAHRQFAGLYRHLEAQWLPRYTAVLTASAQDAQRIAAHARATVIYPNSVPWQLAPVVAEEEVIAFSGNFDYHPNQTAVAWFAKHVWPTLAARHPTLRWRLIGMNPDSVRCLVGHLPRVEFTGPVQDAVQELARARAVVVPLLSGSGTRLKIVEAWAAARPVLSTPLGAEGLCSDNLLIAAPSEFLEALQKLLVSPVLRETLGAKGRACYEEELTWGAAWSKLAGSCLTPDFEKI
jgi:glycosyltransferase involved in cell wall biosynthesis